MVELVDAEEGSMGYGTDDSDSNVSQYSSSDSSLFDFSMSSSDSSSSNSGISEGIPKLTETYKAVMWRRIHDGNGVMFAPHCQSDRDVICFNTNKEKICNHIIRDVMLNDVGEYVVFPARWFHRGYFDIKSDNIYYTAQLFSTPSKKPDAWQNITRKENQNLKQGKIADSENVLNNLTDDIKQQWDKDKYSVKKFPPAKVFDGDKIDPEKNRHIPRDRLHELPELNNLVDYFERLFTNLIEVRSVWLIKKSKLNGRFQSWHRDFLLGTDVTTTIVVNVGKFSHK